MQPIIYVVGYPTDSARFHKVNSVGMMPVCTPKQLRTAIAVYSKPVRYIAFETVDGDNVGSYSRAEELIVSALQSAVLRELGKYKSTGSTTEY